MRKQRKSAFIVTHACTRITLLNGKHSDRLGVIQGTGPQGEQIELTDVERTLIDIMVRPAYAGGPKGVLEA
jgi:predicted transcriptional regulator of viral defense system